MYRSMSAMMLQLRFRATLPRKMKAKQAKMFWLARARPRRRKTAEIMSPAPQTSGSTLGYLALSVVESVMPRGTPTMPESIITRPKMKETLEMLMPLSSSGMVLSASSNRFGAHQDRAPVTKVTQVNARVENT